MILGERVNSHPARKGTGNDVVVCLLVSFGELELSTTPSLCHPLYIGVSKKIGVPQNGWFVMENPIKMDDLGVPPIVGNAHLLFPLELLCFGFWMQCYLCLWMASGL